MRKDLLTMLSFFSLLSLVTYIEKPLKSSRRLRILLVLVLSIFYTTSKAQTLVHSVPTSNPSFPLPAGMDEVTVEAWGAGGAGGAAQGGGGWGRGAPGGGGGAYALGKITGITASTLNVIVGLPGAGGTGNGSSGGASYINGFTGVFYAPGGAGGTANLPTTGDTPPSATPATTGTKGSITMTNGGASGVGYNSLLNLALSSGNGGDAANLGPQKGGAGGLGYASLLGANGAGKPGQEYGGGGSGAASSLNLLTPSTLYNGGSGARGQVNITYTCKTYSLTGISAPNVCTGTTTQVQLTGSAASLPTGTYTVTYNTSRPNAVGQTETMVVGTPGFGSFTARGLTTSGNSTITVTSLTSVDCTSSISVNNVVNIVVSAQPTITLSSTAAVCASASLQNVTLPYSAVTNAPTNYSITWNASPANSFVPVTNAVLPANSISIAIPAGTAGGTYTGSLTVGNAAGCVSAAPTNFTITVNPLPTITLGAATAVCTSTSAQSTTLPYSAVTNAPTTYSITWNSSPTNTFAAVTNAVLPASPINIPIPANTAAGTYTGTLTVRNAAGCVSSANNFTVTVNPLPTITLGATTTVCTSASAQSTTLPYSAVTNTPTTYSITWNSSPTNTFGAVTNAALPASPINIPIPANTAAGTYTGILTVSNANGCVSSANNFTVTVNPLPTITLGATTTVCTSASAQSTTLPYSAVTNAPTTYSITWNSSPTNTFAAVTNAALPASPINIPIPANTAAGTYTGTLTVRNASGCVSAVPTNFTITVNPLPTITLGATTAVCTSTSAQSTTLPYSAVTNAPTTYGITWNASPTNTFAAVTNAALPANPISVPIPANTAAGTYTGTLTVSNANGCVSSANNFTVTVNPLPTITLGATTAVCTSTSAQSTTLPYSAVTNAPTTYSITWNASPTNTFAAVTNAALPANSISIAVPAGTAGGTYTGSLTVRNAAGCVSAVPTNFTITVNPLPTITLGATTAVCTSASAQSTTLPYSAVTNAPTTYSITWNASPTNTFAAVTNAALPANPINIPIPANTAAGTYTGTLTVSNANGCVSSANNFTITVNPLPTITLGATTAVCTSTSAQSTTLPYSAVTNAPTNYSITWNASPTNTFAAVTNAALAASPISIPIPANTTAGTYTGTLKVSNANGCVSSANNFTVTVNPLPTITLGATTAVCTSASAQSTTLPYSAVANAPTTYSITWNASPTNTFAAVTNAALPASPINIPIPANTAAGTYTGTLTVANAAGCISTGNNFTITVNSVPTITTSGNLTPICQNALEQTASLPYSTVTGSPVSYSIDWVLLNDQLPTAFSFDSGGGNINNITVPANTAAGNYSGVMTIFTSNGCLATQAVSLTINAVPTINTAGVFTPVCQSSSAQTTVLSYNSTTGSPVSYEIDWIALTDQGATPFPFSSGSGDIINVNVPANTIAGTYNGIMTITTSNGCPSTQNVSLTVNPIAVAPTASVTQQPSCINNTGVITVTSPASGTGYTYSVDGVDFSNTSGIFTGLSSGGYNVQVRNSTSACESEVTPITINAFVTKVWNGNASDNWGDPANWTPAGVPIASDCIDIPDVGVDPIISGTDASFFASRLTIENNGSLIVEETNSITVTNEVSVLGNGVLIFENNSSLVQIADVSNTGNITYIRKTPVRRFDLTYWSSPVADITMNEFSPETLFDKYFYWTSDFKWATNLYGTMSMEPGRGYSIRGPQSFDTGSPSVFSGEFIGVPNNGTIQGPVAGAEKFCFFGNPYPSAIYADQFIHDNAANFYGTLFFWTHNTSPRITVPGGNTYTYTNDDYAIYNLSGDTTVGNLTGIGAPSPGNQEPLKGYIAAGQGFFAKARTGQRGVFTNSMRVPSSNSQFYKAAKTEVVEKHRVWLNFTNTEGAFKQLLVGYITGATNLFDFNYDAVTMNANPYVDFYSINDNKKLVIQGRAVPFVVTDTIPLGYKSTIKEGAFTIAIDHTDGDLADKDIYLQDKVTNTVHNLKSGGYTFISAPGTFLDRFVLRYTNPNDGKSLGNEDFENQDKRVFVSVKDKNIRLQSMPEQENLDEVAIYDVGGKLLYRKKQIENKEWLIPNFQSGPQVLLVKITLDNGNTVTRKIVFR
ncbi:T9SS sorting signal type C domain-containing protein [Flavobacterium humidisoli]|uniref:T9SS sorting signal type C domain-containing protein n=1 Tax=Flavobacterium humidisoli TaxID=2937442 RepID=A0ABY4LTZ2_9FLAO|nr:T9SS sorting signal type C domain-containing protein [Flavobacterium humidisoli]UPZ16557.1 T9SS sorting signal type C domain-containing protein [Flavobacterium humidisoli]